MTSKFVASRVLAYTRMRLARRSLALGFLFAVVVVTACGRDFDGLFADGPRGDGGSTPPPDAPALDGKDASAPDPDGGTEAGRPCPADCDNKSGCDAGTCTTLCNGCKCGQQTCPASDGNKRCEAQCSACATCDVLCALGGTCNLTCADCTASKLACQQNATSCATSCASGATCEQTCNGNAPCTMNCPAGATCLLQCAATSATCDLVCADGSKKDCGGRKFVCGQSCP